MTTPNQNPRKMPTKKQIAEFWALQLVEMGKFDSVEEVMEDLDVCWGCGMKLYENSKTERAHIFPRNQGGCDELHNLHLLDYVCHKQSEYLSGEKYQDWFTQREFLHVILENTPGEKIASVFKQLMEMK
jgi:hypothetical protein